MRSPRTHTARSPAPPSPERRVAHPRSRAALVAAAALVGLPLLAPPSSSAAAAAARKPTASVTIKQPGLVASSARAVTLRGRARGRFDRTFTVQHKTPKGWRTIHRFRGGRTWRTSVAISSTPVRLRVVLAIPRGRLRSASVVVRREPAVPVTSPALNQFTAQRSRILQDTNALRARHGLAPLREMPVLTVLATSWSKRMAAVGKMTHNPRYWDQYPAGKLAGGENIAYGYAPAQVVGAWADSAPHRANMLGNFNRIGIGVAVDRHGTYWYTQDFAKY